MHAIYHPFPFRSNLGDSNFTGCVGTLLHDSILGRECVFCCLVNKTYTRMNAIHLDGFSIVSSSLDYHDYIFEVRHS